MFLDPVTLFNRFWNRLATSLGDAVDGGLGCNTRSDEQADRNQRRTANSLTAVNQHISTVRQPFRQVGQ